MSFREERRLGRRLDKLENALPDIATGWVAWMRRPAHRLVRIPLAVLLIAGSLLSILPVLGLWMLPFGLLLLAIDVPFLQRPVNQGVLWAERKWTKWRRRH